MSKQLKTRLALIPAFVIAGMSSAHAALPSEVTTAIETAGADLKTAAAAVIVALVAFWGLRKLGSKMGWW
ncbi:MAG: major capsid protein [Pseudomonadota bacterium]|nr:major capsid protein [Pseudomonadota bacterium]